MLTWFIAALLIFIFEWLIGTVYLFAISAALLGAGLAQWLFGVNIVSILVAIFLSVVEVFWVNNWLKKHRTLLKEQETNSNPDTGQTVPIIRHLHGNHYEVLYRGEPCQAEALNAMVEPHPSTAVITGKRENILLIHLH